MGVYGTNFGETPYCCPWNPKAFEVAPPPTKGWGVVPMICQVADAGTNGVFNASGTVLLGDSWVMSNGSVAFGGHAGSRNGAYYFGFASDQAKGFKTVGSSFLVRFFNECGLRSGLVGNRVDEMLMETVLWFLHLPRRRGFDRGWRRHYGPLALDLSTRTNGRRMRLCSPRDTGHDFDIASVILRVHLGWWIECYLRATVVDEWQVVDLDASSPPQGMSIGFFPCPSLGLFLAHSILADPRWEHHIPKGGFYISFIVSKIKIYRF
jgi:hypothetical protein